jgi:probable rRNA maturation factor
MTGPGGGSSSRAITVVASGFAPARGLAAWLDAHLPRAVKGSVTIKIVTDREMAKLNGRFRGKTEATDVLSFPGDSDEAPRKVLKGSHLGDIAIAAGVARRQARALGHPVATEVRILALHGILHLLGYDHERDRGEMRAVEERWRKRAGLPNGLVARADRPRDSTTR